MSELCLTDYSSADKPWDVHKRETVLVSGIYAGEARFHRLAERMDSCSSFLEFGEISNQETGETRLKLRKAKFCRVRHCPICQWRRALLWRAKFHQALPGALEAHPRARFLFLTLTVRNCSIEQLRETILGMNKSWGRFVKLKEFADNILGWVRTTEVTRGQDSSAHPHFHCLLMVDSSYFNKSFVDQDRWVEMWQKSARLDYQPVVDIRTVEEKRQPGRRPLSLKDEKKPSSGKRPMDAITETLKYSVKPADMLVDEDWLKTLTDQVKQLRFIATGGVFKTFLKDAVKAEEEATDEELVSLGDEQKSEPADQVLRFLWSKSRKRYVLKQILCLGDFLEEPPEPYPRQ